jgi:hypothetical protein
MRKTELTSLEALVPNCFRYFLTHAIGPAFLIVAFYSNGAGFFRTSPLIVAFYGNGAGFIRTSPLIVAFYSKGAGFIRTSPLIVAFYGNGGGF